MATTIGYADLTVPDGGDSPLGSAALAQFATDIDPHLWQFADDLADRTTRYAAAPVGTVVVALDGSTWVKIAAGDTWVTIWEPLPDWRPITLATGYEAGTEAPEIRIRDGRAWLRGRIVRTDGTVVDGTFGVALGSVPSDCIPEQRGRWAGGSSIAGAPLIGSGGMECFSHDQDAATQGGAGTLVWWSQDGSQDGGPTGTSFVDITGFYWLD